MKIRPSGAYMNEGLDGYIIFTRKRGIKLKKKNIILGGLLMFCAICWLGRGLNAQAEERQITVYSGDEAEQQDYGDVSDIEHFYVGDTGQIATSSYWIGTEELSGLTWTYTSGNSNVVTVDKSGRYKVVGAGYAVVTVEGKTASGNLDFSGQHEFYCCADVSGATLEKTTVTTSNINYNAGEAVVSFKNLPDLQYYTYSYTCAETDMQSSVSCEFNKDQKTLTVSSWKAGTATITIVLNNQTFTIKLTASDVAINKISAVLAKKKTTKLKITGYSGKVTWKSTKKKTVSVSKKGVVKGKKIGNAVIYAVIDGNRIGCAVSVVTAKRKKVINAAKKIAKGTYSQAKRMSKGYYDCSSLVWRAYQKEGKKFGSSNYAPVAADICKWCFQHKKKVKGGLSAKNIQKMKLRPGDLMFETGANNGRYKGIYHVEMVVGYQCDGFDSNGNPYVSLLWAARSPGAYGAAGWPMARP